MNYLINEKYLTIRDIAKSLNIPEYTLSNICRYYNIYVPRDKKFQDTIENIKDKIYQYYVIENHTKEEVMAEFNISESYANKIFKNFNFKKRDGLNNLKRAVNAISKEDLYQFYIIEGHSHKETSTHFNINQKILTDILNYYNISKKEDKLDALKRVDKQELFKSLELYKKTYLEICKEFNLSYKNLGFILNHYGYYRDLPSSFYENDICNYLLNFVNIKRNNRKILGNGQEIDIYIPEYKVGIEVNGDYWHSSLQKDKNYHFEKSKLAEEKGIRLIHIWEYEWNDPIKREKIISLLNICFNINISKIYARDCTIRKISNSQAKLFNELNHLQGHRNAQVTYGLFYQDKLVQLMSFSKTKYNRNLKGDNNWEIIRGCPGSNNIVVGGVSKLFTHFIRDYNPDSIFSYCDFNKFDGKGYEAIGMKFIGYTGPDMSWVLGFNPAVVVSRSPSKHKELKEKSIAQIWGSGSKKYLWTKNSNNIEVN